MADRRSSGGPQGAGRIGAPQLTLINLFPTPLVVATMPDADALNAELKRVILEREAANESVQRSNQGGWQSSWDLHQWGGAPMRSEEHTSELQSQSNLVCRLLLEKKKKKKKKK